MNSLLRKTVIGSLAILTSMYLNFGTFKATAQDLPRPLKSVELITELETQTKDPLSSTENTSTDSEKQKLPESKENIAVIDSETQEEYRLLQEYFKYEQFKKYEEKYEKINAFKELAKLQEELNKVYYSKDEKAIEAAGRKVTNQEKYINERFDLNRHHTGIKGILGDIGALENELVQNLQTSQESAEDSEAKKAYDLLQEYFTYRNFKGHEENYAKLKAFKELEKLQIDLNRSALTKDEKAIDESVMLVKEKEHYINKTFGLNRSHTGINGIREDITLIEKGLDRGVKQDLEKTKKSLQKKGIIVSYFDCYSKGKPLTLEKYSGIKKKVKENKLKEGMYRKFVHLEKILEYEDYIDKVAKKFEVDKKEMIEVWNQESELNICAVGENVERGLAQFRPITAQLIAKGLMKDSDFKKLDYSFEKLSSNYELNIIMTAAQLASASNIFNYQLKRAGLTFDQFCKLIKEKGRTCTFSKIKEAKENPESFNLSPEWKATLKYYGIADENDSRRNQRIKSVQRIYRDEDGLLKDAIKYIVHNGGGYAVTNIREDSFMSELLLYHLAIYINNLKPLYKLAHIHYGDLYNIIQKNQYSIEKLEEGNDMNIWGVNVSKHDIKQLQKYIEVGLLNKSLDERLKGERIIVIADEHLLDEDMNVRCKLDPYHLLVLDSFENVGKEYEKLKEFKELELLQEELNEAYNTKDWKAMEKTGIRVTKKEEEINKKFGLNRHHTGIKGIQADIAKMEEKITNYGFKPDLEAYEKTKGFNPLGKILG